MTLFGRAWHIAGNILNFVDLHNGAVTAVSTVLIALFTVVLAAVTRRQARLTRDLIALSHEAFLATHRPRVIIHQLILETFEAGKDIVIGVAYVNIGDSPAYIRSVIATITICPPQTRISLMQNAQSCIITENVVASGEISAIRVIGSPALDARQVDDVDADRQQLYCIGMITYDDGEGKKRRTGFNRQMSGYLRIFQTSQDHQTEFNY